MRRIAPIVLLLATVTNAQEWVERLHDPRANFYQVQSAFNSYWQGRTYERGKGYKPFRRLEWYLEPRVYPSGSLPDPGTYRQAWKQLTALERYGGAKSANWQPLGPTFWTSNSYNPGNGRVNVVAVDPLDAQTIYIGTPAGGLWRSTDNGQTWNALFSDLPTLGVSGIAIDPTNTQVIYIGTGDGDAGDSYSIGVLKSTDNGATWATTGLDWQLSQARTVRKLLMHPTDPQTLLCATSNGLWKSTDGADNWVNVAGGSFYDVEYKPGDPTIVYACGDQLFRSDDGGDAFSPITSGLPDGTLVNRMTIAVTAANAAYVYVLCGREDDSGFEGLYRSTNEGIDFAQRSNSPNIFGYDENGTDGGGQSWYDLALAADQSNAQVIYSGGVNVWKSTNGGTDWTIVSHWVYPSTIGYTHADIHTLHMVGSQLYCGSDGGIFRSPNGGADWGDLSAGLNISQFYRLGASEIDPSLVMAGAQDNGCNMLQAGLWTHVMGADGMECAIDPTDPLIIYGESQGGGLARSDDGGNSFSGITSGINEDGGWVTPYVIDPNDPQVLIAGYENLWRSDDRGDSWTQFTNYNTNESVRAIAIAPSSSDVIYFANNSWMRRSLNGGGSWSLADVALPDLAVTSIAVHPDAPQTAYVALSGYSPGEKVFVTTNAGISWTNISGNLPNVPANTIVFQNGTDGGLYVGTDLGVFYTDSTLANWQPFSQGLPHVVVTELEINYAAGKLRASTFGRGLWESDLYTPSGLPPVASFSHTSTSICVGDAVTFTDGSLEAAPGWTWDFPGGVPPSSTDQSPVVTYATSGNYTASLTVSNGFGSDTYSTVIPVLVLPNRIDVAIVLDDYPGETAWTITDDDDGTVVAQGGPYAGYTPGTEVDAHVCLDSGCYTFTITDSYGDGICCGFGNGSYTVTNDELGVIATGGDFGSGESTSFCVSLITGLAAWETPSAELHIRPLDGEGLFALDLADVPGPHFDLQVIDALGRIALEKRVERTALHAEPLDLHHLGAGAYSIQVWAQGRVYSARVVKS